MDLKSMSAAELNKLMTIVGREVSRRKKSQRNEALGEVKKIAAKYGLKVSELIGAPAEQREKRRSATNKPSRSTKKKIAYRHPDNPKLTWSGGRGRKPKWVQDWEAAGRSLDEVKVA